MAAADSQTRMRAALIARELRAGPLTAAVRDSWRWQLRDAKGQWIEMGSRVSWLAGGLKHTGHITGSSNPSYAYVFDDKDQREREMPTSRLTALDPKPMPPDADVYVETDYDKYGDPLLRKMDERIRKATTRTAAPTPTDDAAREARLAALAADLNDRAKEAEPGVSKILKEVTERNGGRMEGFEFRLKERATIAKKIKKNVRADRLDGRETSDEKHAAKIGDALRYTSVIDPDRNVDAARQILAELEAAGHTVERTKNTWPRGDDYSGINVKMRAPNGLPWELQFHTPKSYQTKEYGTHKDYEIYRDPEQPRTERAFAYLRMVKLWNSVEQPAGWENFGEIIKERPNLR